MSRNERLIGAPPQQVFDQLVQAGNFGYWVVGTKQVRGADERWPEVGSSLQHSVGFGPVHIRDSTVVLEIDAPARLVLRASMGPLGSAIVRLLLEPEAGNTRIAMEEEPEAGLVVHLPRPVLERVATLRNDRALRRLERLVESPADAGELDERNVLSLVAGGSVDVPRSAVLVTGTALAGVVAVLVRRRRRRR